MTTAMLASGMRHDCAEAWPDLASGVRPADAPEDAETTLLGRLEQHARGTPDKPFLVHHQGGRYAILTFSDVQALASRIAGALSDIAEGHPDSRVVLLFLKHHPRQLPAYLGAMMAGLIPSFMAFPTPKQDPALYWASHAALIARIRPAAIVTYREIAAELTALCADLPTRVLLIDELGNDAQGREEAGPGVKPRPGDTALLQHSSGTTGLKKGVQLTFAQIEAQAAAYAPTIRLDSDSTVVSWLPYYHDMGLFTAFLVPLTVGAAVVSMDAFEWVARPASLFEAIERFRGTHCWLPNFAFQHLVNTVSPGGADGRHYQLASIRTFVSCSEPVKSASLQRFAQAFATCGVRAEQLTACYAMAETGFAVSQSDPDRHAPVRWYAADALASRSRAVAVAPDHPGARPLVSNGVPLAGVEVRILPLDRCAGACGDGPDSALVGEIAVRGPIVFSGYYEDLETTRAAFEDGWYRTGDIGFLDDGELFISGRVKDVIIVHGRNYYAHDIEEVVSAEAGVVPGRAVAVGVMNEEVGSEDVVVLAETRLEAEAELRALKRAIKRSIFDRLELTVRSVHLVQPGWLTKTSSGKISRSENLARYRAENLG
ncbi:AMP-binding protein [Methylobacterium nodulans]|uniref:AMP-dependent synthetase and ligase n=1 Tax=Methylobacterium nodulans (strain LMG 21967 / CNCM I-2342 / ORS 2060) TaxID=460265 RepID=B8IFG6_METNO|nr:AMP-binding protein [Methylobacterium nodulans]ACL57701.1 AMP-dependent synthetase and ligase [Methylobacterium nodulans ORS 2060]